jgi:PhnB protein
MRAGETAQDLETKEMKKKPASLPRGYRTCTASLAVADVRAALAFYESAFGAELRASDNEADPHFASIKIGNSMLFVTEGWNATGHVPTHSAPVMAVAHHMYVDDVDATFKAALAAGATALAVAEDTYWGERCATVSDPFGHIWTLATRLESLSAEEIEARRNAWLGVPSIADAEADRSEENAQAAGDDTTVETPAA